MVRDEQFMALALEAARSGDPSPNPHVGAVIVLGHEVLSVGHHARAGEAHAEVAAISGAGDASGATLYVTLDPCNHDGRTGPCTEAIIAAGLSRVVIGSADPAPHVPGATARLEAAGIQVERGVLQSDCDWLLAPFRKHITTKLPHVTLKAALTMDGRMATRSGDSRWVTGEPARVRVHELRAAADAILVGVGTVLADDPLLNVRHVDGRDPVRIIVDSGLRTPPGAAMLHAGSGAPTWVAHAPGADAERARALTDVGAELIVVDPAATGGGVSLQALSRVLGARDIVKLLVEGGADVHGAFLRDGLADRAALFMAPGCWETQRPFLSHGRVLGRRWPAHGGSLLRVTKSSEMTSSFTGISLWEGRADVHGLVQEIGQIARVTTNRGGRTFRIACGFQDYDLGESISVDGTCLTVKAFDDDGFSADASQETLAKTTLAGLSAGAHVHLERAVHAGEPLGGHIVTGHVDGVGKLVSRQLVGDAVEVSFGVPHALRAFLAPKGSITVNGVSLTINAAGADDFEVTLVPYTREHTTFDGLPDGSDVNLEVDILAKYVARLLGKAGVDGVELSMGVGLDQLARGGYL